MDERKLSNKFSSNLFPRNSNHGSLDPISDTPARDFDESAFV